MQTFPKLYIFNNNEKIYEWSISIEKVNDTLNHYKIITSHGEKDGNKVIHEKIIESGKAKRSTLEQAILEAQSKWNQKKDKELYSETISLKKNIIVRPMLANKFDFAQYDKKSNSRAFKISFPCYLQRKYDGIRCICYKKNNEVILESRKGIAFQNFQPLKEGVKNLLDILPDGFYFDGELYTDNIDFETISGLIRLLEKNTTPEDLVKINQIQYYIYDFYDSNEPNLTYENRLQRLNNILKNSLNQTNQYVINVPTIIANQLSDIKKYHDIFVSDGFEGIMVRDKDGPYETQKRSKYLQKYKEIMEEEFKIINFTDGTGDEKGLILWVCETKDGKKFTVRPKGTHESRRKLYEEGAEHIGKQLTVIFQEYTNDGLPRFPVGKGIRDIY